MTSDETIRDGQQAQRLLEDELFKRAVHEYEKDLIVRWRMSDDPKVREECHALLKALTQVVTSLRVYFDRGEHARMLAERSARASRRKE